MLASFKTLIITQLQNKQSFPVTLYNKVSLINVINGQNICYIVKRFECPERHYINVMYYYYYYYYYYYC